MNVGELRKILEQHDDATPVIVTMAIESGRSFSFSLDEDAGVEFEESVVFISEDSEEKLCYNNVLIISASGNRISSE